MIRALITIITLFPTLIWSVQSVYCPERHGYVSIGMKEAEVINACGQPDNREESRNPVMEKIQVQQLIYNNQGTQKGFYGIWEMPLSNRVTSNGGVMLQVNIVDNKVKSVNLNGAGVNSFTICNGTSIEIGDPVGTVMAACGSPSISNMTYIERPIPGRARPEIWTYQPGEYQAPIRLTFVEGKLQFINH